MSGGKKKGSSSSSPGGGGRYTDSWSRAGKPSSGLDRTDEHFLDQHGWGTSDTGSQDDSAMDVSHRDGSLPSHQRAAFYRPIASRHQVAYEYCRDWGAIQEVVLEEQAPNSKTKKDKAKKGSKGKR